MTLNSTDAFAGRVQDGSSQQKSDAESLSQQLFDSQIQDRLHQEQQQAKDPSTYNVLDPKRYWPRGWEENHSDEAELFLNGLPKQVTRNEDMSQFTTADGVASVHVKFGQSGNEFEATNIAVQPETRASLNLLFFSLQASSKEDFPEQAKQMIRDLKFDDDINTLMKDALTLKDPVAARAVYLAALEQEMHRWRVPDTDRSGQPFQDANGADISHPLGYYDVALSEQRALNMAPLSQVEARKQTEAALASLRNAKDIPLNDGTAAVDNITPLSMDEKVNAQKVLEEASRVISQDNFQWNIMRALRKTN